MITGLVFFLCTAFCILMFYAGFTLGVRYMTKKSTEAWINALFDCEIEPSITEKVINRTKEIMTKSIKED